MKRSILALIGIAASVALISPAQATEPVSGTVTQRWLLPAGAPADNTSPLIWPQTPYSGDLSPKCETYIVQEDRYSYDNQGEKDAIEAFDDDGVLTNGEDHAYVDSWRFITVEGDKTLCAPPQPPAKVEVKESEQVKCEDKTVVKTITTETTPSVLNAAGDGWVDGTPVVTTETKTRPATDTECPVVTEPPVKEEPPVVPPVKETPPVTEPPVTETEPPAEETPPQEPRIGTPISQDRTVTETSQTLPNAGAPAWMKAGVTGSILGILTGLALTIGARRRRS